MKRANLLRYNVHLERVQLVALRRLHELQGVTPAEQIRRALNMYLRSESQRSRTRAAK
jgi:hypothetical protein